MSIIQSGGTDGPAGPDVAPPPSGQVSHTIGYTVIYANTQEELDAFLNYISLITGKPVGELTEADLYVAGGFTRTSDGSSTDSTSWALNVSKDKSWQAAADQMNSQEFFGPELPGYGDSDAPFLENGMSPTDTGMGRSAGAAGYQGAAQDMYASNYPPMDGVTNPHGLTPITEKDVPAEVWAMLQFLFGAGTPITTGHLNVLKMMGLAKGGADPATWSLTTQGSERGFGEDPLMSGVDLLWAFRENQTDPDAKPFVAGSSMFGFSQSDADSTRLAMDGIFNADGSFVVDPATGKPAKTSADVKTEAQNTVDRMGEGEPIKHDMAGAPAEFLALLNFLYGKPEGTTVFTDAELNAASAMGLVTRDAAGAWSLTNSGRATFNGIAEQAPGTTPTTPPAGPTYTSQQQADVDAAKAADTNSGSTTRYSEEQLVKMGFHPWMADWLMRNCSRDGTSISMEALASLDAAGYFDIYQGQEGGRHNSSRPTGDYFVFFEGLSDGLADGAETGDYTNSSFIDLVLADSYWSTTEGQTKGPRRDLLENFVHHLQGSWDDQHEWGRDPEARTFSDKYDYKDSRSTWYEKMDGPDSWV